jgi:hypothetical protein
MIERNRIAGVILRFWRRSRYRCSARPALQRQTPRVLNRQRWNGLSSRRTAHRRTRNRFWDTLDASNWRWTEGNSYADSQWASFKLLLFLLWCVSMVGAEYYVLASLGVM